MIWRDVHGDRELSPTWDKLFLWAESKGWYTLLAPCIEQKNLVGMSSCGGTSMLFNKQGFSRRTVVLWRQFSRE